jgi:hypothetical protein
MGTGRITRRRFGALAAAAAGAIFWPRRARAGAVELAVIVNPSNGAHIGADDIADIFRTVMRTWPGGGGPIAAFELPPNTDERVFFDRAVLKMDPDDVAHFWIDRRVRGGAPPPHQVPDPTLVARIVAKMANAVGYVPSGLADSSVRIVARVRASGVVTATAGGFRA